jgi:hypothetical protein
MAEDSQRVCCACGRPIIPSGVEPLVFVISLVGGATQRLYGHLACLNEVDSLAALVGPEAVGRWRQVRFKELNDLGRDDRYYLDKLPFTGVLCGFYPTGELQSTEEYRHGRLWGFRRKYTKAGGLLEEGVRRASFREGVWRTWHVNGRLASEELNELGVPLWRKRWDEGGRLIEDYTLPEEETDRFYSTLQTLRTIYGRSGYILPKESQPD